MYKRYLSAFIAMCGILFAADITFQVDATANPDAYAGFGLKGSWDSSGNFDSGWGGGVEHAAFTDADGDDVWEVTVTLVSDGGANTWSWGIQDESDTWIQGGPDFTVPDDNPQTLTTSIAPPGDINVTFRANTSMVQGIVDSTSGIDLRGTVTQWGPGTNLTSVNGDYWEITLQLASGDYEYKYGAQIVNLDGTVSDYWENDIPGADYQPAGANRTLTVGTEDMILDLDFVGSGEDGPVPFIDNPDTIDVYFRVNMSEHTDFDPETQTVYIAGSLQGWDPGSTPLTREGESDYWHVHMQVDTGSYEYKYTLGSWGTDELSGQPNRSITVNQDTTVQWVYWNNVLPEPFSASDTLASLSFQTSVSTAIANNGFELGDTLLVKYGYGGTQTAMTIDTLWPSIGTVYSVTIADVGFDSSAGMYYQYYRVKGGAEFREIYFNFDYAGDDVSLEERRFHDLDGAAGGAAFSILDNVDSNVDPRRMPKFQNTDPIGSQLTVTYSVDLRPAYYQVLAGDVLDDIQGDFDVTDPDSIFAWGVWINGPATPGGWVSWGGTLMGTTDQQMHDDGATGGDAVAGDSVYSVQFTYEATATVGQEFKFGISGGDNESGYGLNHIENIDVDNPTVASFWGSINPIFYDAWDYDTNTPVAIDEVETPMPRQFALRDNYPNPFNPVTTVEFTIPIGAEVTLSIYNLLGQKVATVHNGYAKPGTYKATWNGLDSYGNAMPTGIYLYELNAGSYFHKVKKMTLLK